ncbi:MAG: PLP-dependent aspartate aminotransferase family protein, partial [Halobacteriovoraceae bacterium]|nr:PLP-dependent aspartate aminotransferase family protein [Halobacteriovoraceae bacterium]
SLESAEYALALASGMAAMTLIMHWLPKNSKIICGDDVYGGTYRLLNTVFNEHHQTFFTDTTDIGSLEKLVKKESPGLIWLESPTNPLLKITSIKKVCEIAKNHDALVVVDNTFMSPFFQNPLELGADIVVHSMTKFINGHSDVVAGAIILNDQEIYKKLWDLQNSIGPCLSPFDSWLVLRGVKTLGVRMNAHQHNALKIAKWLEKHPKVERVLYPGLANHPQHKIAKEQMRGFGGMISFFLKGSLQDSRIFLENVKIFSLAESLGGVESLIEHPAIMTHASVPPQIREKLGIRDNLLRLSVGIENTDDLMNDLESAFKKIDG